MLNIFHDCTGLTSVTFGSSVESIGESAFSGCENIKTIISQAKKPFGIDHRTFSESVFNEATLYVPAEAVEDYKAADGWKDFANEIQAIRGQIEGDVNGDGKVDATDLTRLIEILLNQ